MEMILLYIVAFVIGFIIAKKISTPSHGPMADKIKQQIYVDGDKSYRLIPKVYMCPSYI